MESNNVTDEFLILQMVCLMFCDVKVVKGVINGIRKPISNSKSI